MAIAVDHLDRILVAGTRIVNGHSQIVVARFDPSGITLDLTFGNFGIVIGSVDDVDVTMSPSRSPQTKPTAVPSLPKGITSASPAVQTFT